MKINREFVYWHLLSLKLKPYESISKNYANNAHVELTHAGADDYTGWFMPKGVRFQYGEVAICVGAGENISFDVELSRVYGAQVFVVDPTPRAVKHFETLKRFVEKGEELPANSKHIDAYSKITKESMGRLHYLEYGLTGKTGKEKFFFPEDESYVSCSTTQNGQSDKYFEADCLSYTDLISRIKEEYPDFERVKLLKIDIEGSEYEVLNDLMNDKRLLPDVLCFEIHGSSLKMLNSAGNLLQKLSNKGIPPIYVNARTHEVVCRKVGV